jgi:hypothetical protein
MHFQWPGLGGMPAWLSNGGTLIGELRFAADPQAPPHRVTITVPATIKPSTRGASSAVDDDLSKAIRNVRLAHLKQVGSKGKREDFDKALDAVLKDYPDYLPIHAERLAFLDHESRRKEQLSDVVAAADEILKRIDPVGLRNYFASKAQPKTGEERTQHQDFSLQRDLLIDTLYRKGRALGYMELPDVVAKHPIADPEKHDKAFEDNFAELRKWVNTSDEEYYLLEVRRERRKGNFAKALAVLGSHLDENGPQERLYKKRRDLYESLGWEHLAEPESIWLRLRFPQQFEPM